MRGFTLVEVAIVIVVIGLLLGGILKGQELINIARVKNLAGDFRAIPSYLYAYEDKFRALPGDDANILAHLPTASAATTPGTLGNGIIEGAWNSTTTTDESFLFWQHVRFANLAPGPTDVNDVTYLPKNSMSGHIGVSSVTPAQRQIAGMTGSYQVCSSAILGRFVRQLDVQMDDGNPATGAMRAVLDGSALGSPAATSAALDDGLPYTVCLTF